ncbi:hypothetical protein [Stenotrophomonas forensis]
MAAVEHYRRRIAGTDLIHLRVLPGQGRAIDQRPRFDRIAGGDGCVLIVQVAGQGRPCCNRRQGQQQAACKRAQRRGGVTAGHTADHRKFLSIEMETAIAKLFRQVVYTCLLCEADVITSV